MKMRWYKINGKCNFNPIRSKIREFSQTFFPATKEKQDMENDKNKILCPFNCTQKKKSSHSKLNFYSTFSPFRMRKFVGKMKISNFQDKHFVYFYFLHIFGHILRKIEIEFYHLTSTYIKHKT